MTSEGAFSYLARRFRAEGALSLADQCRQRGARPSRSAGLIDTMRENEVAAIFSESTVSDNPARQVARETGAAYGGVLYVDSLSGPDGAVPTYIDLLRVTTQTIADALTE